MITKPANTTIIGFRDRSADNSVFPRCFPRA
jgi:hypothetical protein